ncbi:Aste57867_9682 [Aphanomyces stellatus]|uniref:Aste57867_9682 protein n=1 Tax=Aphanomyces stellatus TaxID=120398 RepID=A0A485KP09_9STRA|nr:hypothetical protein As57867_009644 [Aphanomyces stellatus]VFT86561.1 Aste57867_9682 [Aphanomyces stellatus]
MHCKVTVQYCPLADRVVALGDSSRPPRPCQPPATSVVRTIKVQNLVIFTLQTTPKLPHTSSKQRSIYVPVSPLKRPLTTPQSPIDTRVRPIPRRRPLVANYPPPPATPPVELVHEAPPEESETKNHNKELVWLHHRWLTKHGRPSGMKEQREKMVLMRRWFEFLDTDGSGEIGLNELEDPLVSVGLAKCRMDVRKLIQTVDDSDNGEVNFDEFLSMMHGNKKKERSTTYVLTDPKQQIDGMEEIRSPAKTKPIEIAHSDDDDDDANSVVKLFSDLQAGKLGDLTLPFPILITAYRRRMLLNAHMAATDSERSQGHSVLTALETTRREAAIQEEEDAAKHAAAIQRQRKASMELSHLAGGILKREDVLKAKANYASVSPVPLSEPEPAKAAPARRGLKLPDVFH